MSGPVNPTEAARSDINDILGRYNIVWCSGAEYRPDPRLEWDYEEDENVSRTDGGVLLSLAGTDEAKPPDRHLQPGTTSIAAHLVRETWQAKWTGTYSQTDGLQLRVKSMNKPMTNGIYGGARGTCDLTLYSKDDHGFAFLQGSFDVTWTDCGGTYDSWVKILAKKTGPALRLTEGERQRCKEFIEESEEEEEQDEEEAEGEGSDADKGKNDSGHADTGPEATKDISDILRRYIVVWKYQNIGGEEEGPESSDTVTISRASTQETGQQDPPRGSDKTAVIAELDFGNWRGRWSGSYSKEGGLSVDVEELNAEMQEAIEGEGSFGFHSLDDRGFPFVHCDFNTGRTGCGPTHLEILLKKNGPRLSLTKTEKDRCRDIIGESRDEEEEEE